MAPKKGVSNNPAGKPKGALNKTTIEFKEAVNKLLTMAAPRMVDWLDRVAMDDPSKALSHVANFAEFTYSKRSRVDKDGNSENQITVVINYPDANKPSNT